MRKILKGDIVTYTNPQHKTVVIQATSNEYNSPNFGGIVFMGIVLSANGDNSQWKIGRKDTWSRSYFSHVEEAINPIDELLDGLNKLEDKYSNGGQDETHKRRI